MTALWSTKRGVLMSIRDGFCVLVACGVAWAARAESRQAYLDLAASAYQQSLAPCRAEVERWLKEWKPQVEWGYAPPASPVWVAKVPAI